MSIEKHYINAEELLIDSFKLGEKVYRSGFRPDVIIGVWRGGAPIGIAIQEYLDYLDIPTDHIAIRTSSYYELGKGDKNVKVLGLEYILNTIQASDKLLIVDDVFDTGRSIHAIFEHLKKAMGNNMPSEIKTACPWYKPKQNITFRTPDFYLHQTDQWLVFPHELKGLSLEEIIKNKPQMAKSITSIKNSSTEA